MKSLVHHLSTDINGITKWVMIFHIVFLLIGFIVSLVYLVGKEKIKVEAAVYYALLGLSSNVIFYLILGK